MDYEKLYKQALERAKETIRYYKEHNRSNEASIEDLEQIFPELKESEDEKIRKALVRFHKSTVDIDGIKGADILAWLEKQGESNPYSGVSFKYNGHIWGMCARDNGVDILLDKQLFKHLEKQGEQKKSYDTCDSSMMDNKKSPYGEKRDFGYF